MLPTVFKEFEMALIFFFAISFFSLSLSIGKWPPFGFYGPGSLDCILVQVNPQWGIALIVRS